MRSVPERYCLRWEHTDWGRNPTDYHCAECGERVAFNPRGPEDRPRLVCIECLTRDSPPYEPIDIHNSPTHCSECFSKAARYPGYGKLSVNNWWGT